MQYEDDYIEVEDESSKPPKANGFSVAALTCGIISFLLNPLYLTSLGAIVLGIIGISKAKDRSKGLAITGLVLGGCALAFQIALDSVLSVFSTGLLSCLFCI